jgi:hypothetical protein
VLYTWIYSKSRVKVEACKVAKIAFGVTDGVCASGFL